MPKMTAEELAAAVGAGAIGAITLDTSVFDRYGDDLRNKVLLGLTQFVGTTIKVVFSDIIVSEVQGHIARRAAGTIAAVQRELKNHRQAWGREESLEELGASAHLNDEPDQLAKKQWHAFASAVHASTLAAADHVHINQLTERYFVSSPPFSGTGKKKAEFPDAIALLSLEGWSRSQKTKLLVLSRDGDWQAFAAQSEHLVCLSDIPEALDQFNREARFVASRTMALLESQHMADTSYEIANAVELFFDDNSMEIEAHASPYGFEATLQGAALQYWTLKSGPLVLKANDEEITFVVDLDCKISFEASFSWSIYADGDWHDIGSSPKNITAELDCALQFTVTCSRTIQDEPEVCDVAVTSKPFAIDFGYVDPGLDYEE
jgi:hypothetical protein